MLESINKIANINILNRKFKERKAKALKFDPRKDT